MPPIRSVHRSKLVRSVAYWLAIAALLIVVDPGRAQSDQTVSSNCELPPVDLAFLDTLPPPPASTPASEHIIEFPPPSGTHIDYMAAASIQSFLTAYTECLNAGDELARYSVFTPEFLARIAQTNPAEIAQLRTAPEPVPLEVPAKCTLIRAWTIPSGHTVAVVQITPDGFYNTLLLVQRDGTWMVDDRWNGMGSELLGEAGTGPLFARPVTTESLEDGATPVLIPTRDLW